MVFYSWISIYLLVGFSRDHFRQRGFLLDNWNYNAKWFDGQATCSTLVDYTYSSSEFWLVNKLLIPACFGFGKNRQEPISANCLFLSTRKNYSIPTKVAKKCHLHPWEWRWHFFKCARHGQQLAMKNRYLNTGWCGNTIFKITTPNYVKSVN